MSSPETSTMGRLAFTIKANPIREKITPLVNTREKINKIWVDYYGIPQNVADYWSGQLETMYKLGILDNFLNMSMEVFAAALVTMRDIGDKNRTAHIISIYQSQISLDNMKIMENTLTKTTEGKQTKKEIPNFEVKANVDFFVYLSLTQIIVAKNDDDNLDTRFFKF